MSKLNRFVVLTEIWRASIQSSYIIVLSAVFVVMPGVWCAICYTVGWDAMMNLVLISFAFGAIVGSCEHYSKISLKLAFAFHGLAGLSALLALRLHLLSDYGVLPSYWMQYAPVAAYLFAACYMTLTGFSLRQIMTRIQSNAVTV